MTPRARRIDAPVPSWRDFLVAKPEVTDLTVGQVARRWLEHEARRGRRSMRDTRSAVHKHIVEQLGDVPGRELTSEHVVAWVLAQRAGDYAPASIRRHKSYLSSVCEHGMRIGAMDLNPCLQLPRGVMPPKRARDPHRNAREVLEAAQVDAVLVKAPPMRRILWALCVLAGLRFGEAAGLCWGQLALARPLDRLTIDRSWDCREARMGPTKTEQVRLVPVHPRLRRLLDRTREWFTASYRRSPRPEDPVAPFIHMYRDARGEPRRWHETTALKWWRRDLAEVGVSGKRKLHCSRHSFISLLARAGVPREVRKAMTHTTREGDAHAVYSHFDWATLSSAVCKLGVGP